MSAGVLPVEATNKAVTWSVENGTGAATITTSGVLSGISAGTVTVKATAEDGSAIYGTKAIEIETVPVQTITVTVAGEVSSVSTGALLQMSAAAAPANATNKAVTWSVTNGTGTATIDETTGELTAGDPGTITVNATAADGSEVVGSTVLTITVPVASISISGDSSVQVGQTIQLTMTVAPANATNSAVTWSVENGTGTATSSTSGVLTGTSAGTVTVKATAADGAAVHGIKDIKIIDNNGGGGGGCNCSGSDPAPTPTPDPKLEVKPDPKPDAKPEVKLDEKVVHVEKVLANLNKKVEEAKANPTKVEFKDTTSHWADATVNIFVKLGVVNGYEDGTFRPNASITRAEFAEIIAKVFDLSGTSTGNKLKDASGHWAESSINALTEIGIISGYEDGSFKPDKPISRAEIISIISKILNINTTTPTSHAFTDVDGAWNKEQIEEAASAGLISGEGNGIFAPNKQSTRAEALTIVLYALQANPDLNTLLNSIK
ncbi:S-layer homology domain-containing protein [Paenibacillus frigoriresistens]|nr:S-layer homology domain-containing protein [Paenibacillus frigoriresistens]